MTQWSPSTPPADARRVARFIASSIRTLAAVHGDRWAVTPLGAGALRLNAGYCEAVTLGFDRLAVLVVEDAKISRLRRKGVFVERIGEAYYAPVPGSVKVIIDLSLVSRVDSVLKECALGHRAFLLKASNWALGGGAKAGHRDLALRWIERVIGRRVPRPTWTGARRTDAPAVPRALWEAVETRSVQTRRERNRAARAECIDRFGSKCVVCKFSFERKYGAWGAGYIEVHHLAPLGKAQGNRRVDPKKDLRPVCANCHRMLHVSDPPITPAALRSLLKRAR